MFSYNFSVKWLEVSASSSTTSSGIQDYTMSVRNTARVEANQ